MDQRQVFNNSQEFLVFLEGLHSRKEKASLLVDDGGLSRWEGLITAIEVKENKELSILTFNNDQQAALQQILAVNGIFRSDYSEC
jgi:hypothetical protein